MAAENPGDDNFISGLDLSGLGDLSALLDTPPAALGAPIELDLSLIDEDPNQPRAFFDEISLQELVPPSRNRLDN